MSLSAAAHGKTSETKSECVADERAAASILRGVQRLLSACGYESLAEVPLANGRRADVMAIGPGGDIHIIEIKSSVADFRSDRKWPEYRDYCDAFAFAVAPTFPIDLLPDDSGLILADGYGGDIVRPACGVPLAPARRKAVTLAFARAAAMRLLALRDPAQALDRSGY